MKTIIKTAAIAGITALALTGCGGHVQPRFTEPTTSTVNPVAPDPTVTVTHEVTVTPKPKDSSTPKAHRSASPSAR